MLAFIKNSIPLGEKYNMAHNFFTRKNLLELHAYVINILSGKYWSLLKNGHCEKGKFNGLFEVDKG